MSTIPERTSLDPRRAPWTPPRVDRLPPLVNLTLVTQPFDRGSDEPGLFSFRPGRSDVG